AVARSDLQHVHQVGGDRSVTLRDDLGDDLEPELVRDLAQLLRAGRAPALERPWERPRLPRARAGPADSGRRDELEDLLEVLGERARSRDHHEPVLAEGPGLALRAGDARTFGRAHAPKDRQPELGIAA